MLQAWLLVLPTENYWILLVQESRLLKWWITFLLLVQQRKSPYETILRCHRQQWKLVIFGSDSVSLMWRSNWCTKVMNSVIKAASLRITDKIPLWLLKQWANVLGFRIVNFWNDLLEQLVTADSVNIKYLSDKHCLHWIWLRFGTDIEYLLKKRLLSVKTNRQTSSLLKTEKEYDDEALLLT